MNTAYKIIMIVVGCVVAYFLMSLATNSQKVAQGISSQGRELKVIADLNQKIQSLESQFEAVNNNIRDNSNKIGTVSSELQKNVIKVSTLETNVQDSGTKIAANTTALNSTKSAVAKVDNVVSRISDIEVKIQNTTEGRDDAAADKTQAGILELRTKLELLKNDNSQIRNLLEMKSEELASLQDEFKEAKLKSEKYNALVETLSSAGSEDINKKVEILLTKTSVAEEDAYKAMQKDIYTISARVDGLKEMLTKTVAAGEERLRSEQNVDLRKRVDALEQMINDSKGYTSKLLRNIETDISRNNESIVKNLDEKKNWMDAQLVALTEKIAAVTKKKHSPADTGKTMSQALSQINTEVGIIKQGLAGLEQKVETLSAESSSAKKTEPAGIVVTKSFQQSLVMINTRQGTFIFNPYADFTGVIRVRDAGGNEKMVLVPYTGEYMRIGENIIDTGPFARSCVEGINCNIDVRGSMNAPVGK